MNYQDSSIFSTQEQFRLQIRTLINGYTPEKQLEILREQLDDFLAQTIQMLKCECTYLPQPYMSIMTQYATGITKNCSFQNYGMNYSIFFNRCCNCIKPYISNDMKAPEVEHLLTKDSIVFLQANEELFLILTIQQMKILENEIQQILKYSKQPDKSRIISHVTFIKDTIFQYALTFYLPFLHNRKKSFYIAICATHCEEIVEQALISLFWEELMNFDVNKDVRFITVLYHKTSATIQNVLHQQFPFSMDLRMRKTIYSIIDEIKNRTYPSENMLTFIVEKYRIRLDLAHLLWHSGGDIYAIPKSFEDLTDIDFPGSHMSSEMSDIELYLSITKDLSDLEKCILYDILEYGTVISREHHTRLGISRYQYEKVRKQVLEKLREIY